MSDPVTNIEIEDVLNSIRRLVAQSERPADKPRPAPMVSDRLVLTPALRVAEPGLRLQAAAPTGVAPAPVPAEAAAAAAASPGAPAALRAVGLETALARQAQDWEPDGSEITPAAEPRPDAVAERSKPAPDDPPVIRPGRFEPLQTAAQPESAASSAPVPARDLAGDPAPDPARDLAGGPAPDLAQTAVIVAASATLAPLSPGDDDDEDVALDDDIDLSPPATHDGAFEAEMARFLTPGPIDQDTLRNLVFEIVRQELQGTLGERITRNVRKLVRREIYRVLASQEFE